MLDAAPTTTTVAVNVIVGCGVFVDDATHEAEELVGQFLQLRQVRAAAAQAAAALQFRCVVCWLVCVNKNEGALAVAVSDHASCSVESLLPWLSKAKHPTETAPKQRALRNSTRTVFMMLFCLMLCILSALSIHDMQRVRSSG